MNKKYVIIFALVAAVLVLGCVQPAAPAEVNSTFGSEIAGAEATDADLGDVDTTALDDVIENL